MDRRAFLKAAAATGALCLQACSNQAGQTAVQTPSPNDSESPSDDSLPPETKAPASDGVAGAPVRPTGGEQGHELILEALAANGVQKIFFCGGSDNLYFMESVAKFKALGKPTPDLVTVTHESAAVYMNMGYFQVTRKPQVTMLHVNCGTINAGGAYDEAWLSNAGILVMAGRSPWTTRGEMEGGRDLGVQWLEESYDQAALVRAYCKWDYEIRTIANASLVLQRAFRLAGSDPCGMSYLTMPREVLLARVERGVLYHPEDFAPAASSQGDLDSLKKAARLLVEARNPVVLVKGMGRNPAAVPLLVELAETLALPVVSRDAYVNFPLRHWARASSRQELKERDVVLVIDHDVPWISEGPSDKAKVISLDVDPMRSKIPLWDFSVQVPITCDSAKALPVLQKFAEEMLTSARKSELAQRRSQMQAAFEQHESKRKQALERLKARPVMSGDWVRACVDEVSDENTILLNELGPIGQGEKTPPGHMFNQWGSSLGGAWPRAIGVKLAAGKKTVIAGGGDGGAIFANPECCLMASGMHDAPVLFIVNNNQGYQTLITELDEHTRGEGYAAKAGYPGARLSPSPDFAAIAKAFGAFGERVTDPAQLPTALQRALQALREGKPAVLDTMVGT